MLPLLAFFADGAVVMKRDGKEARFSAPSAVVSVVPLNATEQVVWASLPEHAVVLRFADPPVVLATLEEHRSNRMTSVTTRTWIVDLDGDGTNELVRYATERSDVPEQPAGTTVLSFDGKAFVVVKMKAPGAPWANLQPLAREITRTKKPSWRMLGMGSAGLGVPPPFVGAELSLCAWEKDAYLARVRLLPKREVSEAHRAECQNAP